MKMENLRTLLFKVSEHVAYITLNRPTAVMRALTNRTLTAREAEVIGMVTRVVPDDQLAAQAESTANELARGPTRAYGGVKRLLYGTPTHPLCEQMELENESIADMARSGRCAGKYQRLLTKRTLQFSGR